MTNNTTTPMPAFSATVLHDEIHPSIHVLKLETGENLCHDQLQELGYITFAERQKSLQYRDLQARQQFLAGRCLARYAIAKCNPSSVHDLEFIYDINGKPYIQDSAWHFNLSHSGQVIACAIAPSEIGIDVEQTRSTIEHLAIAQRYFSALEIAWLQKTSSPIAQKFTALWSLKEAYLKALGTGIAQDLSSMRWHILQKSILMVQSEFSKKPWFCHLQRPYPNYWLSVCYQHGLDEIPVRRHRLASILKAR